MDTIAHLTGASKSLVNVMIPDGPAQLPEAACSVNLRFRVEGYNDPAQATGRGATPEEAARNLKATIDATRAALAAQPARHERLAQLFACGVSKALGREDFGLVERLTKAVVLVETGKVEPGERAGMMAVWSLTNPGTYYEVDETPHGYSCTCPDFRRHVDKEASRYYCKHALARMMVDKLDA